MHAIRQYEFGSPQTLRYEEVPAPESGAGQVRIDVEVAGLHLIDTSIRSGRRTGAFLLPKLLGPGGHLVMYGWASGTPLPLTTNDLYAGGLTASVAIGPRVLRRPGGLRALEARALAAATTGDFAPLVDARFGLADAAAAHTAIEDRATMGKAGLVVG